MKLLGGEKWSRGDAIAALVGVFVVLTFFVAILTVPGMPKLFHWDESAKPEAAKQPAPEKPSVAAAAPTDAPLESPKKPESKPNHPVLTQDPKNTPEASIPLPTASPVFTPAPRIDTPFSRVEKSLRDLKSVADVYVNRVREIQGGGDLERNLAAKMGKPDPGNPTDTQIKEYFKNDKEAHNRYLSWSATFDSDRSAAIECLQLTPNQQNADQNGYLSANAFALQQASPVDGQTLNFDPKRFGSIVSYVQGLRDKLADSHCNR